MTIRYGYGVLIGLCILVAACGQSPRQTQARPTGTPSVVVRPTVVPAPAGPDYAKLKWQLVTPLSVLIVATRDKSPTTTARLAAFNEAAAQVEPSIASDMSFNANRLHSSIGNVRDAMQRKDVAALERVRLDLLEIR